MDKGMKKVVNLVTNYMSALCETGRVPGRVDRNIEAGTAVYFPGGGAAEVIESPEDCARVLNEYFLQTATRRTPTRSQRVFLDMKKGEITRLFQILARSRGCYGRLLRNIDNMNESDRERYLEASIITTK